MGASQSSWTRFAAAIEEVWPSIASIVGTIVLALAPIWIGTPNFSWAKFASSYPGIAMVIGVLLSLVGGIQNARITLATSKLKEDCHTITSAYNKAVEDQDTAFREVIRVLLIELAIELKLSDRERISFYLHDGDKDFEMVGRFSKNPEFNKASRTKYPDQEGCLAKAWRSGFAHEANIPDPDQDLKAWSEWQFEKWRIPKKTSKVLRMKSRCIAAGACENPDGTRVGVIVVESTHPTALSAERVKAVLEGRGAKTVTRVIEILDSFEPNAAYAKKEGY